MTTTKQIFDYFCQLEDEVSFIWNRRGWGIGKVLFVLTKYIPFILIPFTLFSTFAANLDVHTCAVLLYIIVVLEAFAIALSDVTFGLRAYAMWNRNKTVLVVYCCVAIAHVAITAFIFQSFFSSVTFGEPPLPIISGCYRISANSVIFASFVVVIFTEAVTTALILYRAFRHFRHTPNALVQNMTRDGFFYCVTMFSTYSP
ncbi:hypothetical protein PAXRUDRAFT_832052 [Paxillus rubicundulus Ve08.2h10]|uniref:DUF6533 domain-containing protein n=1 Tax=Paxillus rubicundulus Ve08.2h10 TaxID=930991 RepID=A0A0D0D561_9AGAM|nr:hypothetical protein PAXRUDRAFT_832052 [Paxillus rubicundulus Ve08.2h10]